MMRSLFSGVAGLKNHQVRMDVIGNNIANVNTVAFKGGRVTFKEGFAQLLQGASRPQDGQGGANPRQVGLGMQVGSMVAFLSYLMQILVSVMMAVMMFMLVPRASVSAERRPRELCDAARASW